MRIPGIFIGNAVGNSRCSRWRPPFRSDIFAGGDGTIITIGANKYFKDLISGKHLPITNYDFDSTWLKGFPYKSVATISAPVGDLDWISHDLNNFWYAIDGTPNQIPVKSCFQDVDYEHVTFFKHRSQVVDVDGIETTQPCVIEWAVYKSVRTGVTLPTCQTYFGVPVEEISTVKWVTKTGDNGNAGTKAEPWLTLQYANDNAAVGDTIYAKTGIYTEGDYLYRTALNHLIGIGLVEIKTTGPNWVLITQPAGVQNNDGLILNGEGTHDCVCYLAAEGNNLTRSVIKNGANILARINKPNITFKNNVLIGIHYLECEDTATIDTCLFDSWLLIGAGCAGLTFLNNKIHYNRAGNSWYVGTVDRPLTLKGNNIHVINAEYFIVDTVAVSTNNFVFQGNKVKADTVTTSLIRLTDSFAEITVTENKFELTTGEGVTCINTRKVTFNQNICDCSERAPINVYNLLKSVAAVVEINYNWIVTRFDGFYHIEVGLEGTDASANDSMSSINIIGNYMLGNKYFQPLNDITQHGIFVGFQGVPCIIKYNHCEYSGAGIVIKGNNTDGTGYFINYNIIKKSQLEAIIVTGVNGVNHFGNTLIENGLREIYPEDQVGSSAPENLIFKNGIAINTTGYLVELKSNSCAVNQTFDYHRYYSTVAKPFKIDVNTYTFAEWQALGYDAHSTFLTAEQFANLFTDYANGDYSLKLGSAAIGTGEDLGLAYNDGLSPLSNFGNASTVPNIVERQQDDDWDCGAYVNFFFDEPIIPDNALLNNDGEPIRNDDGTYILTN